MDCSIEIKLQAIDKMIAMREQLAAMQDNLGMNNGFSLDDKILVYRLDDLKELSKATGNEIHETGYVSDTGFVEVAFGYKEVVFHAYLSPEEHKAYKDWEGLSHRYEG